MTILGEVYRKHPAQAEEIVDGPTKFHLMLTTFDGEHTSMYPRLYSIEYLSQNGNSSTRYKRSFQAHIYGAVFDSPYWIIEGVDGYWGMSGLVKSRSFIAQYDTEKKKGQIKFLDKIVH